MMRRRTEFSASWYPTLHVRVEIAVVVVCLMGGCSGRPPYELAPVEGVVTIDDKPIVDAKVMFAPVAQGEDRKSGKPAFGVLGSDGRFTLSTYHDQDGAIVGDHWVTVIRLDTDGKNAHGGSAGGKAGGQRAMFDRLAVPRKVSVVAGQTNQIAILLKASEVKQFGRFDD